MQLICIEGKGILNIEQEAVFDSLETGVRSLEPIKIDLVIKLRYFRLHPAFSGITPVSRLFRYFYGMNIDAKVVENLAHLARLRFDDDEKESIRADLEKMVAFVEKLQTIDTTGVAPLLHISDAANVLREDLVQGSITRDEALLNSPVEDEAFFKVPKVIKK
jgi:aspartyl-tRNA(Asn)/glutamyl-tRNA(Gln) amidotransferase subunit C